MCPLVVLLLTGEVLHGQLTDSTSVQLQLHLLPANDLSLLVLDKRVIRN